MKALVSSMQISTCTWHVALVPEVAQMVFCMLCAENSAPSSIYPLSNQTSSRLTMLLHTV